MSTLPARRVSGLYAVTPESVDSGWLVGRVTAALAGGASAVQYRSKSDDGPLRTQQARLLLPWCRARHALLIINDDVELAQRVSAHGVHLGRDDMPLADARAALGPGAVIGVSCYDSLSRALDAQAGGADYVAFGSFFASTVKPGAVRAPPELLSRAREVLRIPAVAIGGITPDNAGGLIKAGADAVAVISALFHVSDTQAAARAFAALFPAPDHQHKLGTDR